VGIGIGTAQVGSLVLVDGFGSCRIWRESFSWLSLDCLCVCVGGGLYVCVCVSECVCMSVCLTSACLGKD
jgi:hypothetical protein